MQRLQRPASSLRFCVRRSRPHQLATLGEAVRQPHHVEDLQRAGVYADRPALQRHPVALVDDAGADASGEQLRSQYEPGGAGAHDEHLAV